jgi:transposase
LLLRQPDHESAGVVDDTTLLLGLDGVVVDRVDPPGPDGCRVVHLITAEGLGAVCPSCRAVSTSVKQRVMTRPRDVAWPTPTRLVWHKRRWRCQAPGCGRGSFTDSIPQLPPRARVTARLKTAAGQAVAVGGRTIEQAGRDHGLSWQVVAAAFTALATALLEPQPEPGPGPEREPGPVTVLGIDETRRGRPRFTRNAETGKTEQTADRWHTGFVDLHGGQGLLGQVEGRSATDAGAWLAAQPPEWRAGVQVVAIDMCPAYRAAVREHLPAATLVVDHFHVVQLANQTISQVRRRATTALRGRRVRASDPEYGIRRRLLRNREDLTDEQLADMWNRLIDLGAPGEQILAAWIAKEELRALLALARTQPLRHAISARLYAFYQWCADTRIPELHRLAGTVETWWPQIEAFLHTGVTNAAAEGINRVIKLEARNAYGFRNPINQRLRSRCATSRKAWRQTQPA